MEEEKIQLTLDTEQKPNDPLLDSVPTMQSVVKKEEEPTYSAGTFDESMLSDEEKQMVEKWKCESGY